MTDDAATPGAFRAGAFTVVCWARPLLIAAVGSAALWLANSVYVLIPATVIGVGLGGLWYYRRRMTAQGCGRPIAINKASNHERLLRSEEWRQGI